MEQSNKFKAFISEKAPGLAVLYQNKYVGMIYDRFASLPPQKQKRVLLGVVGSFVGIVVIYLVVAYISLWSLSSETKNIYAMNNMIVQYQQYRRDRSDELALLARNSQLSPEGQLKQVLLKTAATSGISPRMIQVEERGEAGVGGSDSKKKDVKIKESLVSLQKVNLTQLLNYLKAIEYGNYNLIVSSIKMTNDDKLRGYLNVELTVMAHLFETDEGG